MLGRVIYCNKKIGEYIKLKTGINVNSSIAVYEKNENGEKEVKFIKWFPSVLKKEIVIGYDHEIVEYIKYNVNPDNVAFRICLQYIITSYIMILIREKLQVMEE